MLDPQKKLEREALLERHRKIQSELAQIERNIRELEAQLRIEEQLSLKLRRFIDANIPELAGKVHVQVRRKVLSCHSIPHDILLAVNLTHRLWYNRS